ncbi:FtsW/RodA/SpoVE family cell cycle protein [Brevibacillus ginsengisoli]|uniref:FtsW/RodA/SpoVE family cell cycle protein n=1 Tax=Brevibacillus ginsengisoli TaxID=363854 RepID=UPI003CF85177
MNGWKTIKRIDPTMLLTLLFISVFSTIAIYSTTINRTGMENMYMKEIVWQVIAYSFMSLFIIFDYRIYKGMVPKIGYGVSLFLLILLFFFPASHGAHSWISLSSGLQIQPSEFAKIFVILTIADYMTKVKEKNQPFTLKHFLVITLINLFPFLLILKQPALGQALTLLGITGSMLVLFLSRKQLIYFLGGILILITVIVLAKTIFFDQTIQFVNSLPFMEHQKERIVTFLDPHVEELGTGYQLTQAQIAIGTGELFGKGISQGTVTNDGWVPEQWTDFIFSAVGEQVGFVGSSILLFLFFILLYRMISIASETEDYFSTCFITGVVGMFMFQIIENVGMNLSLMPVAGITLPFVSYGGSSLLTNFILVGIVLSMKYRSKKLNFE